MKILITGGAGFIGANFIKYINDSSNKNVNIVVIDNESVGKKSDINQKIDRFLKLDISNKNTFKAIDKNFDAVIHLAAKTEVLETTKKPSSIINDNIIGTFNVFEFCRNNNIKKIIVASTGGAIIGNYNKIISESTLPKPISPYGVSKLFNESLAHTYNETYKMNITCLRFSNVYGPGSHRKNSVISKFMRKILLNLPIEVYGDGEQKRDFIYVDDISRGIIKALKKKKGQIYQLSSGNTISINKLIKNIKKIVSRKKIKIKYSKKKLGEVFETKISNKKAQKDLKFKTKTKLEIGLKKTWESIIKNI